MDGIVTTTGLLCLVLVAASAADLRNHDDLYDRLEKMEQRYAKDIAHLEDRVVTLEAVNKQLVAENNVNKADIATLKIQVAECKQWKYNSDDGRSDAVGGSEDNGSESPERTQAEDEPRIFDAKTIAKEGEIVNDNRKRALIEGTNVAFTAYVDHDLDNQGSNQILIFNKVLLNHGNAYNNFSGTFTAPMAGVYSFTFFIGQRDVNQYYATLVVNNQHTVDAVCETLHVRQDLQGGNTANLILSQGDIVFVRHLSNIGTHVEGAAGLRISSFSGFLIYPVEEPNTIIGK